MANGALIEGVGDLWSFQAGLLSAAVNFFSVRGGMLSVLHYGSGVI